MLDLWCFRVIFSCCGSDFLFLFCFIISLLCFWAGVNFLAVSCCGADFLTPSVILVQIFWLHQSVWCGFSDSISQFGADLGFEFQPAHLVDQSKYSTVHLQWGTLSFSWVLAETQASLSYLPAVRAAGGGEWATLPCCWPLAHPVPNHCDWPISKLGNTFCRSGWRSTLHLLLPGSGAVTSKAERPNWFSTHRLYAVWFSEQRPAWELRFHSATVNSQYSVHWWKWRWLLHKCWWCGGVWVDGVVVCGWRKQMTNSDTKALHLHLPS